MYDLIKIGDKEVPMLAMASVDIYYKQIFGDDILRIMTDAELFDNADRINAIQQMGFVMAKLAELKDPKEMRALNEDNYIEWLEQFSRGDMLTAYESMQELYMRQTKATSTEKNVPAG